MSKADGERLFNETTAPEVPGLRAAFGQFKRVVLLIRPYWRNLLQRSAISIVIGIIGLAIPYFTKLLVDEVYPSRDVGLLTVLVGGSVVLAVTTAVMSGIQSYFTLFVNARLNSSTALLFFTHVLHLPMRFFEEHQVGEVMSRFSDVRTALQSVARVLETVFLQGTFLLLVPPVLFLLQWKLALIALISFPLTATLNALAGRSLRQQWKHSAEAYAEINALEVEVMSHARTLKSMALEPYVFRRATGLVDHSINTELRAGALGQMVGTSSAVLTMLNSAFFTWLGWRLILSGEMTLGGFLAFAAYVGYVYEPVNRLFGLYSEFQQSAVSFHRMFEYLDRAPEQDPASAYGESPAIQHRIRGAIEFDRVSFNYNPDRAALHDVSLRISSGTATAVVGVSGSGKTTLLRLLVGTDRPSSGQILIDDTPIEDIPLRDLRRQTAVVWQDSGLLRGTVWENLTIGLDDVSPAAVEQAARVAQIDETIRDLPNGYRTSIAEWGASVSAGQRQRLAIARALVRDTPVLLLDEVTANVDARTEERLLEGLFAAMRGRTLVFVTHRVATALLADVICVMDGGRVAGMGTHADLLSTCPTYRLLWQAGSRHGGDGATAPTSPQQRAARGSTMTRHPGPARE